jgi:DNA polymerase-3 subunit epsilon
MMPENYAPLIAAGPRGQPASCVPSGNYRFIALDVETACSDASSICQIGIACVMPNGAIETWKSYVNPRTHFSTFNIRLHGIEPGHVADAPDFAEAITLLEPLFADHHIIQHSSFDRRAIHGAYALMGREAPPWTWGDSVRIARRAWPEFSGNGGHGLSHLKQRLKLVFDHHDAGEDARAAAQVVLHAERRTGLAFDILLGVPRQS